MNNVQNISSHCSGRQVNFSMIFSELVLKKAHIVRNEKVAPKIDRTSTILERHFLQISIRTLLDVRHPKMPIFNVFEFCHKYNFESI